MKRSSKITLRLMMGAASLTLLSGCVEEENPARSYRTLSDCVADGVFAQSDCRDAFGEAERIHAESAPRYATDALCEEDFGDLNCGPAASGSGFVPFMTGYLVAEVLDEAGDALKRKKTVRPFYSTRDNLFVTVGGAPMKRTGTGTFSVPKSTLTADPAPNKSVMTRSVISSKGGFGSRGGSFGG